MFILFSLEFLECSQHLDIAKFGENQLENPFLSVQSNLF